VACIWFIITNQDKEWIANTLSILPEFTYYEDGIWTKYWISFYTAVFMLIGAEILPVGILQHFYCSAIILISLMVTTIMFGEIAVVMTSLRSASTRFT